MLERHIGKIEMHTLKQQVGSDKDIRIAISYHSAIVAHPAYSGVVYSGETLCQTVNKAEFAKLRNLHVVLRAFSNG